MIGALDFLHNGALTTGKLVLDPIIPEVISIRNFNCYKSLKQKNMKTKIFTLLFVALFLITGMTQTSGQGFSLGVKAGAGFSYISHFNNSGGLLKRSPTIMVDGGLIGNIGFTKLVSLQFEILYEQKGEQYKMSFLENSSKSKLHLDYLTLPILVEFAHSFGNVKLFGGLGPYIGYALGGKMISPDETEGIKFGKNNFRRFDAGAAADLGVGIKAGKGHIILDLRYNYGLIDLQQPEHKPDGYKPHCNRNAVISVGYIIPLGK